MLKWLMNLFFQSDARQTAAPVTHTRPAPLAAAPKPAATKGVQFDPLLIQHLKDDHRVLLGQYGDIKAAAAKAIATQGDWKAVETGLIQLRRGLTDHLMTETIKLYVYLQLSLAGDREKSKVMRSFSSEMAGIGKVALDFIDKNRDIGLHPDKQEAFLDTWNEIGKVLGDRIAREEKTLYPMYDASHSENGTRAS